MKHTILGAGGSIGNSLAHKLLLNKENVRLVSRSKFSIFGTESVKADLNSAAETKESVKDSDVVYLCAGLPYDKNVWEESWPKVMQNTIDACKSAKAKLIFFDNVYMYGKVDGKMTEESPYNPCSKKGEIRANIALQLENEIAHKNIEATIARAADLYGPYANKTSMLYILVFDKLMKSKKAQWAVNANVPHSFTYTLDCANSLYLLANDTKSFNQVWHLPTYNPAPDGKSIINMAALELSVPAKQMVVSKTMFKMISFFDKTISEIYEMLYQYEFDYYFDSSKFNNYFKYQPKSYKEGIKESIAFLSK